MKVRVALCGRYYVGSLLPSVLQVASCASIIDELQARDNGSEPAWATRNECDVLTP